MSLRWTRALKFTAAPPVLAVVCAWLASQGMLLGQPAGYLLTGRIMDTSSNALSDVRIELKQCGAVTNTDGNGFFNLRFSSPAPLAPDADGCVEILELSREQYHGRMIRIANRDYFKSPIAEKMERSPVGKDCARFTALMPEGSQFIDVIARIKPEAPHAFTAAQLRELLDQVALRSRNAVASQDASFYAWVPEGTKRVRAAFLISLHGIGTLDHPVLRKFARENDVALIGVFGDPIQRGCYPIELMDQHLNRLGVLVGHAELETVPVLTFGHSNGTGFATAYAVDRPDRLISWVSYHSGWAWQLLLPHVEKAPGLVLHGHLDEYLVNGQEQAVKDLRRLRDAPVGMMLEGCVAHAPVDADATWEFIVEFCKAAMRLRLNPDGTLRPVIIERGWLGGIYDRGVGGPQLLPIAPTDKFPGDRSTANWLPDEEFARIWQAYGNRNPRK